MFSPATHQPAARAEAAFAPVPAPAPEPRATASIEEMIQAQADFERRSMEYMQYMKYEQESQAQAAEAGPGGADLDDGGLTWNAVTGQFAGEDPQSQMMADLLNSHGADPVHVQGVRHDESLDRAVEGMAHASTPANPHVAEAFGDHLDAYRKNRGLALEQEEPQVGGPGFGW